VNNFSFTEEPMVMFLKTMRYSKLCSNIPQR
jgi:hypothetical protein